MKARPSNRQGAFSVEIWLADDHSLFISPQAARSLARDILAILQEHEDRHAPDTPELQEGPVFEQRLRSVAPPDYLENKVAASGGDGPAKLLIDGKWRGNGTAEYAVFNIQIENDDAFRVRLPKLDDDDVNLPVVMATSRNRISFPVYDARKHPGSGFEASEYQRQAPKLQSQFRCPQCRKLYFRIAVGFELAGDYQTSNDTVWFALAVKCAACDWEKVIFEDETA